MATVAGGAEKMKPVGARGDAMWTKWEDYEVLRGTPASLPHDGHNSNEDPAAGCDVPPLAPVVDETEASP